MTYTVPPSDVRSAVGPALVDFVQRVNYVIAHTRVTGVNSWWRSVTENYRVGGDPCSQHLYGLAVDLQHSEADASTVLGVAAAVGLVGVPISRTATHLQYYPAGTLRGLGACPALA